MRRRHALDDELDRLAQRLPRWAANALRRTRHPSATWFRVPIGVVLVAGGILGFLPILGFWMVPLGLALIALDVPFMRGPLARLLAFINRKLAARDAANGQTRAPAPPRHPDRSADI
jgi:hypothetical protein